MTYEVVIPARNAVRTLSLTLTSLQRQTVPPARITVVDDGSSDGTASVIKAHGVASITTTGLGLPEAQNLGLFGVTEPFVAFVDADDVWTVGAAGRLISTLRTDPTLGAVAGQARTFEADIPGETVLSWAQAKHETPGPVHMITPGELWRANAATKSGTMFRTDMIRDVGGYRPLVSAEDYDLLLRSMAWGWNLATLAEPLCWRLTSTTTMTANSARMFQGELAALEDFYASEFRKTRLPYADLRRRQRQAWFRALARDARFHGNLHSSPAPPGPILFASIVQRALAGRLGTALAFGWRTAARAREFSPCRTGERP